MAIPRGICQSQQTKLSIAWVMLRIQIYQDCSKIKGATLVPCTCRTENRIKKCMRKRKDWLRMVNLIISEQENYLVVWLIAHFTEMSSGNLSTVMAIFSNRRLNLGAQLVSPLCGNQLLNLIKQPWLWCILIPIPNPIWARPVVLFSDLGR